MTLVHVNNDGPARWPVRATNWLAAQRLVGPVVLRVPCVKRKLAHYRVTDFPGKKAG